MAEIELSLNLTYFKENRWEHLTNIFNELKALDQLIQPSQRLVLERNLRFPLLTAKPDPFWLTVRFISRSFPAERSRCNSSGTDRDFPRCWDRKSVDLLSICFFANRVRLPGLVVKERSRLWSSIKKSVFGELGLLIISTCHVHLPFRALLHDTSWLPNAREVWDVPCS